MYKQFLAILFLFLSISTGYAENAVKLGEYSFLKSLLAEGYHNPELYLELSNLEKNKADSLCFAKKGLLLAPSSQALVEKIKTLQNSDSPLQTKSNFESFVLKNFYPESLLSNFLLFLSFLTAASFIISKLLNSKHGVYFITYPSLLASIFLVAQLILTTPSENNHFRVVKSLAEIGRLEGISLDEFSVYSSPDENSQLVKVIKSAENLFILNCTGDKDSWCQVETQDRRTGWINQVEKICRVKL